MKATDMTPEFKEAYDKHYIELRSLGIVQPKLSSLAKQYAKLDLEVKEIVRVNER